MQHFLIIGDGVVGLCAGVALARAGHGVLLVGDGAPSAASLGNAGHIAVEQVAPLASMASVWSLPKRLYPRGAAAFPVGAWPVWLPFGLELLEAARADRFAAGHAALKGLMAGAMPAWRALADILPGEPLLRESGHLVLWEDEAGAAAGLAGWQAADTGTASFASASAAELSAVAQVAKGAIAGIRFAGTAQMRSHPRLMAGLRQALLDAGGRIEQGVATTRRLGDRIAVSLNGDDLGANRTILVAAGARSGELMRAAGHRAPLVAERGYHLRWQAAGWPGDLPPLVFEQRSLIVAKFEGYVQASSFVEFARFRDPPDPGKWNRLERHIRELGLPVDGDFTRWMGARPTLPDYLPAIGRSARVKNLCYAFGHQHLGLTLAPVTAQLLVQLADGGEPGLAAFDIERFRRD